MEFPATDLNCFFNIVANIFQFFDSSAILSCVNSLEFVTYNTMSRSVMKNITMRKGIKLISLW